MDDYKALAELLFPDITKTTEYYEKLYPPRDLDDGARVTRFAPSPTGFLHFGNLFTSLISYECAKQSNGVFFVRVEDTDQKRKVEGSVEVMLQGLKNYCINPSEGVVLDGEIGNYGPYYQSKRREIYRTYAKNLTENGLAYPCFCTEEELNQMRQDQENDENENSKGYFGKWAKCRNLSYDEIKNNISKGMTWTLRLKSPGTVDGKCIFSDIIKGKIEMPENIQDIVILKSDGIPTYHFAHVIDDHLMHTTHVIRGDEWISSTPIHLQLFKLLGFKPPKYAHVAPIMKIDEGKKRKLSKRKDPEMAITYYDKLGYPKESVIEYMMTLANSDFEDWRKKNKEANVWDFPFNLKKMSISGALFDMAKLNDISKNIISKMNAENVMRLSYSWAEHHNKDLSDLYKKDFQYITAILNIDRESKNPRKDIANWSEIQEYISYMYDETFKPSYQLAGNATPDLAVKAINAYIDLYSQNDDKDSWFSKIKSVCPLCDCTDNVKEFKQHPEKYIGHVGDISTIIRVALTGRINTPDLFYISKLLGNERVKKRLSNAADYYLCQINNMKG